MYTTGEIAACLCLETPGLDTLDILVFWKGFPTVASTRTILVNAALAKAHYLEQNQYVEWPADAGLYDVTVPGQHGTGLALPWGGTSHPVWFRRDPRVANVRVLGGVFNRALMQGVPQIVAAVLAQIEGLPEPDKLRVLTEQAAGVMSENPPRENTRINTSLDSVYASGPLGRAHCVIHGNSNYKQTGLLQAYAAYSLLQQPPGAPASRPAARRSATGSCSACCAAGTGGTTGRPKGVMLTGHNIETMTAITLMSYPFRGRPRYLALAPLTHAAGVLCFPVLTLGGEIVIMPAPDLADFLALIRRHAITHTFLPPTLIYMLLGHPDLPPDGLPSLQCLWYGAAPMSATRLAEAIEKIGPVLGQLFGQTEAPMMISHPGPGGPLSPQRLARHRTAVVGRPAPLVQVAVMGEKGRLLARRQPGEIVCRSSLVMAGYYQNPEATAEASRYGWHHTGDIGYLDEQNYLFIVDRAKDMIITGGFNVYSAEVEQVLLAHPAIQDCAVVGLPDEKWGERLTAVVQPLPGRTVTAGDVRAFVRDRLGSVKAPKQVEVWPDLPRSKVGKVLKADIKSRLRPGA